MSDDRHVIAPRANAATLRVLGASALRGVLVNCAENINAVSGTGFDMHWGTSGAVNKRMADGEVFDLVAGAREALETLRISGKVRGDILAIGASRLAMGVRSGEFAPDILSAEKFRAVLLSARMIARGDPAGGGTAGNHLVKVFAQLDVTAAIAGKSILRAGGYAVMKEVADGNADFGLTQSTEIPAVAGVKIGGYLPDDVQLETVYAIAEGAAGAPDARDVMAYLRSDEARRLAADAGFAPA